MKHEAARGALLGLAVGDALGTTYEFARIDQPAYPTLATGPATDVVGGGPFTLPAGAVTDDTQMAVCLARSLAERGGLDLEDVAARYVAWSARAFDIGNQTASAIDHLASGVAATEAGLRTWRSSGRHSAGNGSLMRTAPIAVALRGDAVVDGAIRESLITHADPKCALACAVFDAAIACAIAGDAGPGAMLAAARGALELGGGLLAERLAGDREDAAAVVDARAAIATDLSAAEAAEPGVYGADLDVHRTAGFVRVALRLAFWHLVHARSWHAALVDVASRGGDADTNAAIVGALLGARFGASAIPEAWTARVLGATQRGEAVWGETHHPRHLLALLA